MDIKIGFSENPRELTISARDNRDELVATLTEGLKAGSGIIELTDSHGRLYLVDAAKVAYVEVGSTTRAAVGFGGI